MSSSSQSTASLISSRSQASSSYPQRQPKDFSAAFASLQSTYGAAGGLGGSVSVPTPPTPVHQRDQYGQHRDSARLGAVRDHSRSSGRKASRISTMKRFFAPGHTTVDTPRSPLASSTALSANETPQPKNFEAAFGNLQSSYGFGAPSSGTGE